MHHIIECDTLRTAVDLYLKLIYDDIKEQSSRSSGNLFTKLVIEQTEDPQNLIKMEFTIKEVIERRTVFYHLLEEAVIKKSKIYSKIFLRVKLAAGLLKSEDYGNSKNDDNLYSEVYYETKRYYH